MREILFRGKRADNREWAYGFYVLFGGKSIIMLSDITELRPSEIFGLNELYEYPVIREVCPDTVGQFTGLLDKNGNKIFEGDIIQYCERRLMVWWNDEAFQWQAKSVSGYDVITFEIHGDPNWTNIDFGWIAADMAILGRMEAEVIGNKWDNPELLNP